MQERYQILQQISQGKDSQTFIAVKKGQNPPVNCVIQRFSLSAHTWHFFWQKVKYIQDVAIHPQIPSLLDNFHDESDFYLVSELIDGKNLTQLLTDKIVFNESNILQILEKIIPVLYFIHSQNLIHGDINPNTIIIKSSLNNFELEDLMLVDLGNLQIIPQEIPLENIFATPGYIAPEFAAGNPTFASDLYSLGITCIYLLTHVSPFELYDTANQTWVWREYLTQVVSSRLSNILDKLIDNNIETRFQSVEELAIALGISNQYKLNYVKSQTINCLYSIPTKSSINTINFNLCNNNENNLILASGHDDATIQLWNFQTKELINTLRGHSQAVKSLEFSPDGKYLASASDDKTIKLWDIHTNQEIYTFLGHSHCVKSVAFSPDSKILASGSWDKTIKLWNLETGKLITTLNGHKLAVTAITFSPSGNLLASASLDRTVSLWKIPESQNLLQEYRDRPILSLIGHNWAVLSVAFSPNQKILATGSEDNTIKLWNLNDGEIIATLTGHSWSVFSLAFSDDGKILISGSQDTTIKLWNVDTLQEITTCIGHTDTVSSIVVHPVANMVFSGSRDKTIKLWQLTPNLYEDA
ncbi:WD40 repeat domain-containing serine/threonine-protein kinase [Calothrix sp. 336/3]|uniref:WD40 repeat domain-containing serine/threonine-protein kinase n=1 Tax=Calothrix sp. 336/3 TaxID=1337936 RepID=UPI000AD52BA1|nr:WD40 repeat domain-containing serine/threonine-protein kinase [Calothrix sp. 336/3]